MEATSQTIRKHQEQVRSLNVVLTTARIPSEELAQEVNDRFAQAIIDKYKLTTGEDFVIDEWNKNIFQLLCWYFTRDPRFESQTLGMSLKKGILLRGNIGVGKSVMMDAFKINPVRWYTMVPCRKVTAFYGRGGMTGTETEPGVKDLLEDPDYWVHRRSRSGTHKGICFDDLGTDVTTKHFGTALPVMEIILQDRYELDVSGLLHRTHITTNFTSERIELDYGPRVRSRMAEQYNQLAFHPDAPDRRKIVHK